jgi:hypothetical protein
MDDVISNFKKLVCMWLVVWPNENLSPHLLFLASNLDGERVMKFGSFFSCWP